MLGMGRHLSHHFGAELRASCFTAAFGVVIGSFGLLTIFTKLSLLVVSNGALHTEPQVNPAGTGPVVLYLSEAQWQGRYQERSPLDRCHMADDLEKILARGPRSLTVDFDLSPGLWEAAPACRTQLDAVIDNYGRQLVLLMPFRVSSPELIALKAEWMRARCRGGAVFGDGSLNVSLGAVIDFVPGSNGMADAVHARGEALTCAEIGTPAGAARWLQRGEDDGAAGSDGAEAINFTHFARQAAVMPLEHPAFDVIADWARRDVFFGGDYGGSGEDYFLTPMGRVPGVVVHAAMAWSLANAVRELPHLIGFGIDILIGFIFSLGLGYFWQHYLKLTRRGGYRSELSTISVLGLLVYFSTMLWMFFKLAVMLFLQGVLIVPLLMAIGMLIDGFMRGPIDSMRELDHTGEQAAFRPGTPVFLALAFGALAFLVWLFHGTDAWLAGCIAVPVAILIDRYGAKARHAHDPHDPNDEHHGQDDDGAPAWPKWCVFALLTALGVALAFAADRHFHLRFGAQLNAFVGVNGAVFGLLLVGCGAMLAACLPRQGMPRPLVRRPAPLAQRLLGVAVLPATVADLAGAVTYFARQAAYWAVVAAALTIMLEH